MNQRHATLFVLCFTVFTCTPDTNEGVPPELEVTQGRRIGTISGEGTALTGVISVLSTDSTVFVLETSPARLAYFDLSGEWLGDLATAGGGPGELSRPRYVGLSNGRLWVGDPLGGRLEVYTPSGEWIRSYRFDVPPDSGGARAFPMALLEENRILMGPGSFGISMVLRDHLDHQNYYVAQDDPTTAVSLYRRQVPKTDFFEGQIGPERYIVGSNPLQDGPLVEACQDGSGILVIERWEANAEVDTFRVQKIAPGGADIFIRNVEYRPIAAGEKELTRRLEEDQLDTDVREGFLAGVVPKDFFPPVSHALCGADGSVWFAREETAALDLEWYGLDSTGEWIGRVRLPKRMNLVGGTEAVLWGIERDALDVPFVVENHVTGPS